MWWPFTTRELGLGHLTRKHKFAGLCQRFLARQLPAWEADPRVGFLLVGDIDTAVALAARVPQLKRFNVGGVHHRTGRKERLRFVYLTDDEAAKLRQLAARGVDVTAQDVPTARAVPVTEFT